jgi:type IV secretion system protein VirB4
VLRLPMEMVLTEASPSSIAQAALDRMGLRLRRLRAAEDDASRCAANWPRRATTWAPGAPAYGEHHLTILGQGREPGRGWTPSGSRHPGSRLPRPAP